MDYYNDDDTSIEDDFESRKAAFSMLGDRLKEIAESATLGLAGRRGDLAALMSIVRPIEAFVVFEKRRMLA